MIYQFTCLPFGLSPSAKLFTKTLKPVIAFLRSMGICLLIFFDDILIMADSLERAAEHTEKVIRVLESLGFVIKKRKSTLKPTQTIPFLGFIVNSLKMLLLLSDEKLQKLKSSALSVLENMPTASEILSFLGQCQAALPALQMAPLHFRAIQRDLIQVISPQGDKVNYKKTNYKSVRRCNQGSTLVDSRPCTSKWQGDYSSKSGFSNFVGCFEDRMGSSSSRIQHSRSLERARSPRPCKSLGAGSSISGFHSFFASDKGESCPVWPGQLHCSSVHQPAGRYKISAPHSISTRHMVLHTGQEHGGISNSCSRKMGGSHSRWEVQSLSQFYRMDAGSQSVQTDYQAYRAPSCRSVCLLDKSSDAKVCVLEARTRGNSNRCFRYPLRLSTELPVSSILPDTNVPKESNTGTGRLYSHCSSMEKTAMVSSAPSMLIEPLCYCLRVGES